MLQFFKNIIQDSTKTDQMNFSGEERIKIATCALFLELANSDEELASEEMEEIYAIMKRTFDLNDTEIENLIELSKEQIAKSVSLYEFTDVINKEFTQEEKYEVVKNLWRIILADKVLSPHEEHFIKKISGNMQFYHKELIAAKLEVKEELKSS